MLLCVFKISSSISSSFACRLVIGGQKLGLFNSYLVPSTSRKWRGAETQGENATNVLHDSSSWKWSTQCSEEWSAVWLYRYRLPSQLENNNSKTTKRNSDMNKQVQQTCEGTAVSPLFPGPAGLCQRDPGPPTWRQSQQWVRMLMPSDGTGGNNPRA